VLIATQAALRAVARAGRVSAKTEPGLTEKPKLAQDYEIGKHSMPQPPTGVFRPSLWSL